LAKFSILFLLCGLASVFAPTSGVAGRFCADRIDGGLASGSTEQEAREAAITWWSSRAGALGKGYQDWAAAEDKEITCQAKSEGVAACKAAGRPCLPEGTLPENAPKLDL